MNNTHNNDNNENNDKNDKNDENGRYCLLSTPQNHLVVAYGRECDNLDNIYYLSVSAKNFAKHTHIFTTNTINPTY
ncbi:hypothetical protein Glove_346g65 [Diversispora epigaea]|uniref:Uncharacterized protein n=1 Tax=Diversispora epigaea TaxID=1348612 RepID=A0A397HJX7_9GLOM|nr:hypothetical protein Glove_346g65 [Diversispora epigaea]